MSADQHPDAKTKINAKTQAGRAAAAPKMMASKPGQVSAQMNVKASAANSSSMRMGNSIAMSASATPSNDKFNTSMSAANNKYDQISFKNETAGFSVKGSDFATGNSSSLKMNIAPMGSNGASKKEQVGFSISGGNVANVMKENYFGGATKMARRAFSVINGANRYARCSVAMSAVPESAEGSWGDVKRQYVVGGNWKSNGDKAFVESFPGETLNKAEFDSSKMDVCVAPTAVHLTMAQGKCDDKINVMSQDVSQYGTGAYTGNITSEMMKDLGISWTLTGHSERRTLFHETDEDVAVKTKAAIDAGMKAMLCIGEQLAEREAGETGEVNARQLKAVAEKLEEKDWEHVVIAYEPVWAIGTGKVATPE